MKKLLLISSLLCSSASIFTSDNSSETFHIPFNIHPEQKSTLLPSYLDITIPECNSYRKFLMPAIQGIGFEAAATPDKPSKMILFHIRNSSNLDESFLNAIVNKHKETSPLCTTTNQEIVQCGNHKKGTITILSSKEIVRYQCFADIDNAQVFLIGYTIKHHPTKREEDVLEEINKFCENNIAIVYSLKTF